MFEKRFQFKEDFKVIENTKEQKDLFKTNVNKHAKVNEYLENISYIEEDQKIIPLRGRQLHNNIFTINKNKFNQSNVISNTDEKNREDIKSKIFIKYK